MAVREFLLHSAVLDRLNGFRSAQANVPAGYAEAFHFEPSYPFMDIRDLLPPPPRVTPVSNRQKQALDPAPTR